MPHVILLKDGSLLTPFDIKDLLDAVEQCAGSDLREALESYISENVSDIAEYESEYERMDRKLDRPSLLSFVFSKSSKVKTAVLFRTLI